MKNFGKFQKDIEALIKESSSIEVTGFAPCSIACALAAMVRRLAETRGTPLPGMPSVTEALLYTLLSEMDDDRVRHVQRVADRERAGKDDPVDEERFRDAVRSVWDSDDETQLIEPVETPFLNHISKIRLDEEVKRSASERVVINDPNGGRR